jgi:hypothetical protein
MQTGLSARSPTCSQPGEPGPQEETPWSSHHRHASYTPSQPRMPRPRWSRRHSAHEPSWRADRTNPPVTGMLGAHIAAVKRQMGRRKWTGK